jgi:hypothetical protein
VAGKYIACVLFFVVLWLPTVIYLPILTGWHADTWWNPGTWSFAVDPHPVMTAYLGLLLAGMMFLAVGLFVSSLVKNQLVAAVLALAVTLPFVVAAFWRPDLDPGSVAGRVVAYVSVPEHFRRNFCRGVIDTRNIVLYLSMTALALLLTVRSLEARRLR